MIIGKGIILKILLPVDLTNASVNEAKKATEIAKTYNCPIKFIGVIGRSEQREHKQYTRLWRQVDNLIFKLYKQLIKGKAAEAKLWTKAFLTIHSIINELDCSDCHIESEVLVGKTLDSIIDLAKNDNAGLIIISDLFLKQFFASPFAEKTILEAPCPVLIVNTDM